MARRQRKKKKVLAGFARATGDRALTASIHDLVVLPELQGLGLGRKLLAKATNQVIGFLAIAPLQLSPCHAIDVFQARLKILFRLSLQQENPMPVMLLIGAIIQALNTPDSSTHVWCFVMLKPPIPIALLSLHACAVTIS